MAGCRRIGTRDAGLYAGQRPYATRDAGSKALNAIAARVPWLMGGSGDLAPSTKTLIEGTDYFRAGTVREPQHCLGRA